LKVGRVELGFDPSDVFRTVSLQTLLNHQADAGAIEIRQDSRTGLPLLFAAELVVTDSAFRLSAMPMRLPAKEASQ